MYRTYCTGMLASSPQRSSAAATTSGLFICRSPTMVASGSAGMTREMAKETVTIPSRRNGTISSRRSRYCGTSCGADQPMPSIDRSRLQQPL